MVHVTASTAATRSPDSNAARRAASKSHRERDDKLRWLANLVREADTSGCREWPWARNNYGYGVIRWDGKVQKVGHVVLELSGRPRPGRAGQLHSCDNPACCAPWHLRWGDQRANMQDCRRRGRRTSSPGTRNGLAKLTDDKVREILTASERSNADLGRQYGVHPTIIDKIRRGKIWRHLSGQR